MIYINSSSSCRFVSTISITFLRSSYSIIGEYSIGYRHLCTSVPDIYSATVSSSYIVDKFNICQLLFSSVYI